QRRDARRRCPTSRSSTPRFRRDLPFSLLRAGGGCGTPLTSGGGHISRPSNLCVARIAGRGGIGAVSLDSAGGGASDRSAPSRALTPNAQTRTAVGAVRSGRPDRGLPLARSVLAS